MSCSHAYFFFFFNDTATTEIYTLSLHDALPICHAQAHDRLTAAQLHFLARGTADIARSEEHTSSSHSQISYAVFCLKKKKRRRIHAVVLCLGRRTRLARARRRRRSQPRCSAPFA